MLVVVTAVDVGSCVGVGVGVVVDDGYDGVCVVVVVVSRAIIVVFAVAADVVSCCYHCCCSACCVVVVFCVFLCSFDLLFW